MPYMKNGKRDYKREYELYQGRPDQIHKRAERVEARRAAEKSGMAHKGDGKDLDHTKPLSTGGSNKPSNWRMTTPGKNRSFARNSDGSLKSQTSKRERKR